MKMNIFQLKKAASRLRKRRAKIDRAINFMVAKTNITPEAKEAALGHLCHREGIVDQAEGELRVVLLSRRVGQPGVRQTT